MKGLGDLFTDPNFQKKLAKRLEEGWTFEKIEPMSTDEILTKLNRLGIPMTADDYRAAAQRHESAQLLAEEWYAQYPLQPEGRYDEDFVWMASILLWGRLVPDRISFEQIDNLMQKGYGLVMAGRTAEGCDTWWQVWEWLKEKTTPERNTLERLDADFRGTQEVYNWCQDFEIELGNAGVDDPKYHRLRIRYCQEFLETFSDIDWQMRGNFLRAEAKSYWQLGEIETAETKLEALIEENPDWAWGYIEWSDNYWLFRDSPKAYDRAEAILKRALARPNLEDRGDVQDRLDRLQEERAQVSGQKQKRKRRRRKR
ncbi:MAG TPA: zinc chelation protein SecC [Chloroflexi bacterium]|nr:zinc chelation protein SecC [Chloroflexota bacterium]